MRCEEALQKIEDYSYGELTAYEAAETAAHLRCCADCSAAYKTVLRENEAFYSFTSDADATQQMWLNVRAQIVDFDSAALIDSAHPKEDSMNVFSFIEYEPLWVSALREIREAALQFIEDPKKFLSQIFDADPFESRRRRYLRVGATLAMFVWIFCGTVYAGWHFYKISSPAVAEGEGYQKIVDLTPLSPELIRSPKSQKRASGGGGGGNRELTPPSRGRLPQASLLPSIVAPSVHTPKIEAPLLPVVPTVQVQPELLPQQAMNIPLGDPKGVPGPPSDGPGSGGGIGTGKGGGVGSGDGRGVGPGRGWNTGGGDPGIGGGDAVYSAGFAGVKSPQILEKVKPKYTEEARRDKIQGQVVLTAVFRADGTITEIKVIKGLGFGLDEEAMKAAAKIRFIPGLKDGRSVNVRARIEFSFSLL